MGGFVIICPECGSKNCEVDAFLHDCMSSYHKVAPHPMIYCLDCEYEWNEFITTKHE